MNITYSFFLLHNSCGGKRSLNHYLFYFMLFCVVLGMPVVPDQSSLFFFLIFLIFVHFTYSFKENVGGSCSMVF